MQRAKPDAIQNFCGAYPLQLSRKRGVRKDPKIVEYTGFKVAGVVLTTTTKARRHTRDILDFWNHGSWELPLNEITDSPYPQATLGVRLRTDAAADTMDYMIAKVLGRDSSVPSDLKVWSIPGGRYICFRAVGDFPDIIHQTWDAIFRGHLPNGGWQYRGTPAVEWYDDRSALPNPEMQFFIPIQ